MEQHTELTQEDEKLLDEIMATESDWYRTAEEAEEKPQANADKVNGSEAPVIEMEQSTDDLIGREIIIDNRKYLIESIGKISGDVSLRDITFQNNVGFPINRVEKIGYIQKLLEQEKTELPPEEKTEAPAAGGGQMSDNWVIQNLENALNTWNEKLAEIWQLITQSPENFKGGTIWNVIVDIHGAVQAIGLRKKCSGYSKFIRVCAILWNKSYLY